MLTSNRRSIDAVLAPAEGYWLLGLPKLTRSQMGGSCAIKRGSLLFLWKPLSRTKKQPTRAWCSIKSLSVSCWWLSITGQFKSHCRRLPMSFAPTCRSFNGYCWFMTWRSSDWCSHWVGLATCSARSEEHTSELQSPCNLVCRLLLGKNKGSDLVAQVGQCARRHGIGIFVPSRQRLSRALGRLHGDRPITTCHARAHNPANVGPNILI